MNINKVVPLSNISVQDLRKITDSRGNLTPIESGKDVPFEIKRIFYIYDVNTGDERGAHAHYALHQMIICLSGALDVELHDGKFVKRIHLNRPWQALHIPPGIWASEGNFDQGTVYLVLASDHYDEKDYIRSFDEFVTYRRNMI